jgi:ribosomal protein L23
MKIIIEATLEESKSHIFKAFQALFTEATVKEVRTNGVDPIVEKRREYQRQQYRKRKQKQDVITVEPEFPENNILVFNR